MLARPRVGVVMRDRILSSVLLPAPLRPMMPTTSPRVISNETSSSAQMWALAAALRRTNGARDEPRERVAQRAGACADFGADDVALAEMFDANGGVGHEGRVR